LEDQVRCKRRRGEKRSLWIRIILGIWIRIRNEVKIPRSRVDISGGWGRMGSRDEYTWRVREDGGRG
jgi:hypothetical protein